MEYYYRLLEQVTTGTDSSLILFFVIVAAMLLPLYYLALKGRRSSLEHEKDTQKSNLEREKEIVTVIKEMGETHASVVSKFSTVVAENTAVISSFKTLLADHGTESKGATARIHDRIEQVAGRIHDRIDLVLIDTSAIKSRLTAGDGE